MTDARVINCAAEPPAEAEPETNVNICICDHAYSVVGFVEVRVPNPACPVHAAFVLPSTHSATQVAAGLPVKEGDDRP